MRFGSVELPDPVVLSGTGWHPVATQGTTGNLVIQQGSDARTRTAMSPESWASYSQQTASGGGGSSATTPGVSFTGPSRAQQAAQQALTDKAIAGIKDPYTAKLQSMMEGTFTPSDPSYKWRLEQGQQAVERSAAAQGLLGSGNVLQSLMNYGQGAASTEYQNQFSRLLAASQNITGQYDATIRGLASAAGVGTQQQQAQTSLLGTQASGTAALQNASTNASQASFGQQYATNQSQGLLDQLMSGWGGGGGYSSSAIADPQPYYSSDPTSNPANWGRDPTSAGNTGFAGGFSGNWDFEQPTISDWG